MQRLTHRWLEEGRQFQMICWWLELHRQMTDGEMVDAIEDVVTRHGAFTYPIEYIKPRRDA